MTRIPALLLLCLFFTACTNEPTDTTPAPEAKPKVENYPKALQKIFTHHGTLDLWQTMNTLSYEIANPAGNERQFVDLKNRREKIESREFITGFDGENFWVEADTSYTGNPVFYHNLMFYFYAMPFVLADEGIIYAPTKALEFEGKTYPGIKISYQSGVGVSPEDEYFIHYDSETYEMAWLGYTVTYYSKEKSEMIGWIRYDDWKLVNDILLPNTMSWYKTAENLPIEFRNKRTFENVKLSKKSMDKNFYEKTANAVVVENDL